jgi:hypothetical protein
MEEETSPVIIIMDEILVYKDKKDAEIDIEHYDAPNCTIYDKFGNKYEFEILPNRRLKLKIVPGKFENEAKDALFSFLRSRGIHNFQQSNISISNLFAMALKYAESIPNSCSNFLSIKSINQFLRKICRRS